MPNASKQALEALLPKGSAWEVKAGSDLDDLYDVIADANQDVLDDMIAFKNILSAYLTNNLEDLEVEYGIEADTSLTDAERRGQLAALMYDGQSNGSPDALENALTVAGFTAQVHQNNLPIDPSTYIIGDPLVNGLMYNTRPAYTTVADATIAKAGNERAKAGAFTSLQTTEMTHSIPTDSNYWPAIFFVGGDITRDVSGNITNIASINIDARREEVFKRIILKYRPMGMWAALVVYFV